MDDLKNKAQKAVIWNTGFCLFRDILQFCLMMVLVRLIPAKAYGQFGLVNNIIGFISVFSFSSFASYIIQVRNKEQLFYQDYFTAGGVIQVLMFLISNIVAFFMSFLAEYRAIAPVIHFASIIFLLQWPTEIRLRMLEWELDWKRRRILHSVGLVLSAILAIVLGLNGCGVYALYFPGMLVTLPFIWDLFMHYKWRPTFTYKHENFLPALKFGITRIGSEIINKLKPLLESAMLISFYNYSTAGFFGRGMGLGMIFCQKIAVQLILSIYPVITKIQPDSPEYRNVSGVLLRFLSWVIIPIACLCSMLATPIVNYLYGSKWTAVIPLIPGCMIYVALGAIVHVLYMLLLGNNNVRLCVLVDVIGFIGFVAMLFIFMPKGLQIYLYAQSAVYVVVILILIYIFSTKGGIVLADVLKAFLPPLIASCGALFFSEWFIYITGLNSKVLIGAILYGILFSLFYAVVIRVVFSKYLLELFNYMPHKQLIAKVCFFKQYE